MTDFERGAKAGLEAAAICASKCGNGEQEQWEPWESGYLFAREDIVKAILALAVPADPASGGGENARPRVELPDDLEIAEFKPHRHDGVESGVTEWVFEDCGTYAKEAFPGVYHFIDELRAMKDGRLVGVQFWGPPPKTSDGGEDTRDETTVAQMVEIYQNQKNLSGNVEIAMRAVLIFVRSICKFDRAAITARDAEIAALRAALTPFAKAARLVEKDEPAEKSLFSSSARYEIKLSDLLQARDAIAKEPAK